MMVAGGDRTSHELMRRDLPHPRPILPTLQNNGLVFIILDGGTVVLKTRAGLI
jgi:hypothetical protein